MSTGFGAATGAGVAFAVAALAGCSGGGDGSGGASVDNGMCRAIADAGATVEDNIGVGAGISNSHNVFDGNLDTAAVLTSPGGAGTSTIRGTLHSGSEPAGEFPGVLFQGTLASNTEVTVTTYLDGVAQDSGPAVHTMARGADGMNFFGIPTTHDFDSIEVTFSLAGDAPTLTLYELCIADF